jgi:hypothetical protein
MKENLKVILTLIVTLSSDSLLMAQEKNREVIQFSGVIVSGDSLQPVPFVNVMVKNTYRGTVSDYYGFFSFVAQANDTIQFSALGYQPSHYIIPSGLSEKKYSIIQMLQKDTILLKETVIYPWPTREQFERAFVELKIPDDDLATALKNLSKDKLYQGAINLPMDASLNYKFTTQQFNTKLYNAGQIPMNNLLNPIAWARFVEAWKNGDFKKPENRK